MVSFHVGHHLVWPPTQYSLMCKVLIHQLKSSSNDKNKKFKVTISVTNVAMKVWLNGSTDWQTKYMRWWNNGRRMGKIKHSSPRGLIKIAWSEYSCSKKLQSWQLQRLQSVQWLLLALTLRQTLVKAPAKYLYKNMWLSLWCMHIVNNYFYETWCRTFSLTTTHKEHTIGTKWKNNWSFNENKRTYRKMGK